MIFSILLVQFFAIDTVAGWKELLGAAILLNKDPHGEDVPTLTEKERLYNGAIQIQKLAYNYNSDYYKNEADNLVKKVEALNRKVDPQLHDKCRYHISKSEPICLEYDQALQERRNTENELKRLEVKLKPKYKRREAARKAHQAAIGKKS